MSSCCPSHLFAIGGMTWCAACGRIRRAYGLDQPAEVPENWSLPNCNCTSPRTFNNKVQWCPTCGSIRSVRGRKVLSYWQRPKGPYAKLVHSLRPIPVKRKKEDDDA